MPLVFFRGEWVEVDASEMQRMQELIEESEQDHQLGSINDLLSVSAQEEDFELDLDASLQEMTDHLWNKNTMSVLKTPQALQATLRPYQERGLSWLSYLESLGMNACLADDMGLGKTMQVIALLLESPMEKPALLVAPTSLLGNWEREIQKFAPTLNIFLYYGSNRKKILKESIAAHQIVITSYGLLRQDKKDFQAYHWSRVILDEAQNIKNPMAAQSKAIFALKTDSKIALTGTPIENRLMDLWSIFHFLNRGYLGAKAHFRKQFELPIQRDNDPVKSQILKKMVEPFILRRMKTDKSIIRDLPDKIEQKVYCQLTQEQALIYQAVVDEVEQELEQSDGKNKSAIFISSLLKLKQVCNHPVQALQDGSAFSVERSMKLKRLCEMSQEIIANNESLLIFSQFTEVCEALQETLRAQLGCPIYYLHGGTSLKNRNKMVETFQEAASQSGILILSLKAGGVGLTLTQANHVIHFDRWWNPAVENQATDRAYRIGQEKTVFAYKFITTGTIEETIDRMIEDKQKVSDMIVSQGESWLSQLNPDTFMDLIKLKKEMVAS